MFHVEKENLHSFAAQLRVAMASAGMSATELAQVVGVSRQTVSNWRQGHAQPDKGTARDVARAIEKRGGAIDVEAAFGAPRHPPSVVRETPAVEYKSGWPAGWQARAYRLATEAAEAGASEEEIAVVRGWMMDPQLQLLWSGGAPKDLKELDGIEAGARAWLRARGRMVKKG